MGEPHEENSKCKLLFWFSLEGDCGGPKKLHSFHLPLIGHMDRTPEVNFCFDLLCKAVMKVQRSSIVFTYMGAPHVQNN
jgi:hypothetical protein